MNLTATILITAAMAMTTGVNISAKAKADTGWREVKHENARSAILHGNAVVEVHYARALAAN